MRRVGVVLAILAVGCSDGGNTENQRVPPPPPPLPNAPDAATSRPDSSVPLPDAAAGAVWRLEDSHTGADLHAVWGSGPGDVYAVGTSGTILHTPGWRGLHVVEANFLDTVWGSGAGEVYVGSIVPGRAAGAPIFRSTDGGDSFSVVTGVGWNTVSALWGSSAADVWIGVASDNGDLKHSTDHLATVTSWGQTMPALVHVVGVCGDAGTMLVARSDGLVERTSDRSSWTSTLSGVTAPKAIAYAGGGAWVVGDSIAYSTDRGASWTSTVGGGLSAVFAISPSEVWAVGAGGVVLHATDGHTFVREAVPTSADLHGVWASGPRDVYAVGAGGTILHFSP
jgi:hypothetical protein